MSSWAVSGLARAAFRRGRAADYEVQHSRGIDGHPIRTFHAQFSATPRIGTAPQSHATYRQWRLRQGSPATWPGGGRGAGGVAATALPLARAGVRTARGCQAGRRWGGWAALLIGASSAPQASASGFRSPYTIPDTATVALGILLAVTILATAGRAEAPDATPEALCQAKGIHATTREQPRPAIFPAGALVQARDHIRADQDPYRQSRCSVPSRWGLPRSRGVPY